MAWGGAGTDEDKITKLFMKYREESNFLISKYTNCLKIIKNLKKIWNHEKSEVLKKGLFDSTDKKLEELFKALDLTGEIVEEIITKLKDSLVEEKKDIDKYLGNLKHNLIEAATHLEKLSVNYIQTQYDKVQDLNTKLPSIVEIFSQIQGTETSGIQSAVNTFNKFFIDLMDALKDGVPKKERVYPTLEKVLFMLEEYGKKYKSEFVGFLSSNEPAKIFANNFFKMDTSSHFVKKLKKFQKDAKYDPKNMTYDNIEGKNLDKIDKFMKETLEALFKGVNLNDDDDLNSYDKIKDKIKELIPTKTNIDELAKDWKDLKKKLQKGIINAQKSYIGENTFVDLIVKLESKINDKKTITIGEFEKFLKDKNIGEIGNLEFIIENFKIIIYENGSEFWEEDTFENFLNLQVGILETKSSKSKKSGGKGWLKDVEVPEDFDILETIKSIDTSINGLLSNTEEKWDEGLNDAKKDISYDLQAIAQFIKENESKFKLHVETTINSLESSYDNWKKQITNNSHLKQLSENLINLLKQIENSYDK